MSKIFSAYRNADSIEDLAKEIADYLKDRISCEAISIFMYEQASDRLNLLYATSTKINTNEIKSFGPHSPIFQMFKDKEDRILSSNVILNKYHNIDVSFENIDEIYSIVFARIFDSRNTPFGVVRAINKLDHLKKYTEFTQKDRDELISASNILGSALTARFANKRIISFLDSVTHELLAPIAGVKNIARFLIGYLSHGHGESSEISKERISNNIKGILNESEQLILLVENLTMYSRSGRMNKRDIELCDTLLFGDVLRDVIKKLKSLPTRNRLNFEKVIIKDYHQWPMVRVDRNMMSQVFTNILHNSIKYSTSDSDDFLITIYHKKIGREGFQLFIEDNGIGIEPSAANKIFHPGIRGENAKALHPTSTGIGLSTVKNLLALHDMNISVTKLKSPTTFCITIPRKIIVRR